ncbi:MAG: nucleotidyltransferase domain-containing protein [Acidobacteriota bacterium]
MNAYVAQCQHQIDARVRTIVERFHPEKIILFGSYADGTAGPDSDVDLLVVMKVAGSRRDKAAEIDLALAYRQAPLDLIVITPEQFERDRDSIGTIVRPAVHEGRTLYDRGA